MEEQGYGGDAPMGYCLTPYAGKYQLGVVFSAEETLEGWFEDDQLPAGRLLPIAEISGSGGIGALWLDDAGEVRFVGLADGTAFILADNAIDVLRLCAIGDDDLGPYNLGLPPDRPECVEAVADFRAWVEQTYDVEVPSEWDIEEEDEFTDRGTLLTAQSARAHFGDPELAGEVDGKQWLRFMIGGGYLHFTFEMDGRATLVAAMIDAPWHAPAATNPGAALHPGSFRGVAG